MDILIECACGMDVHKDSITARKTDVKDAEWIAQLLRHGLLMASFIPNRNQRELRELVRFTPLE